MILPICNKRQFFLLSLFFAYAANIFAAHQHYELLAKDVQTSMHMSVINPLSPHLVFTNEMAANAWLDDMSQRLKKWIKDDFLRKRYLTMIQYEATRAELDPQLILSIITVESKFNKYAISKFGARGFMQVMPFWPVMLGFKNQDLFDTQINIRYGCIILRYYLQQEHGDLNKALARYNGSINKTWYPELVFKAYKRYWQL